MIIELMSTIYPYMNKIIICDTVKPITLIYNLLHTYIVYVCVCVTMLDDYEKIIFLLYTKKYTKKIMILHKQHSFFLAHFLPPRQLHRFSIYLSFFFCKYFSFNSILNIRYKIFKYIANNSLSCFLS